MATFDEQAVRYYQNELTYLRNSGQAFAQNYPKIARRLELSSGESPDPHVERLIESFAFLTGKVTRELDERYPEAAAALLGVLYPNLVNPIPSMSIAVVDNNQGNIPAKTGINIARGTNLVAQSASKIQCFWQTVYEVQLWPIKVTEAAFISTSELLNAPFNSPWCVKIKLNSVQNFSEHQLNDLTFFLGNHRQVASILYSILLRSTPEQIFIHDPLTGVMKRGGGLKLLGFESDELSLPNEQGQLITYALLQEYFHFPQKFMFIKLIGLQEILAQHAFGKEIEIIIPVNNNVLINTVTISKEQFNLYCTPVINLFKRACEPITINYQSLDYQLIPDIRRQRTTEIYQILAVTGHESLSNKAINFEPFYSLAGHTPSQQHYWYSRRKNAQLEGMPGTQTKLSFVDRNFKPVIANDIIVMTEALCTNRYLASQLTAGTALFPTDSAQVAKISLLQKPVELCYPPDDGATMWMLISQLSSNYLSLLEPQLGLQALKGMLQIFANRYPQTNHRGIDDLRALDITPITKRFGNNSWQGFVTGYLAVLDMNLENPNIGNNLILANIIRHYLGDLVDWNSFVQTRVIDSNINELAMEWEPLPGEKIQL